MRPWRNRQTRTFEGRVGDRTGSSPVGRTILKCWNRLTPAFFYNVRHIFRGCVCSFKEYRRWT